MTQACGKIPDNDDTKHVRKSIEAHGNKFQGDIGEQVAAHVAVNELNLTAENFDPPNNGFDSVYRDSAGKLVIVESKMTLVGGMGALHTTKNYGKQGSVEWVRHTAESMCDPYSGQYSPDNAKIGAEILRVGPENVHLVYIHTSPTSLESTVTKIR